ncbi:MAG: helicase-exonuclease AddAB subunit AddB [Lachnospiraceae bacterium]|jgi:ATP-dependent helicase/nuclease subunit B|nr:helicase-exonuclease AddAB subunit AddB [Lachnospiraceae bacterium]
MALQFILGNSGVGKSHTLYQTIIRKSKENPEQKILVLVPEQFTMQTQKDLVTMHPDGGILNIDVLSFQRLAYRVFEETGTQVGKVLEETGKNLVLRKIAQEHKEELKILGGNLKKTGYINEIKSLISELTQYAVTEEELEQYTEGCEGRPHLYWKLRDLQILYRAFHAYLADQYITAEELLEVLCEIVERSETLRNSEIVLDGFTGFTPIQNKLLRQLLQYAKNITVTVTIDSQEDPYRVQGEHQLFYMSKKTIATLAGLAKEAGAELLEPVMVKPSEKSRFGREGALFALEQNLFRLRRRAFHGQQAEVSLHLLRNPEEEVAWTAFQIRRLIGEQGYHYRDFAVITGNMEAYGHCLERIFPDYGIPCFLDYKRSILGNPFVEFLRALLEMTEQDFAYETVFRFLRSGLSGMKREETDLLENYVLALGIRGRKKWGDRFIRTYGSLTEEELSSIDRLREQFAETVLPFAEVMGKKAVDVRTRTTALYRLIESLKIQGRLTAFEERFQREGNQVLAKEYHQIYPIVMDLLDKLVDLLGDQKLTVREYREVLEAGFAEARVGVIPPGVDQVVAGDMERTRLKDVKVLFFLGVNEGSVPKNTGRTGLLSDMEREQLKARGMELAPTAREQSYIQRFYLYLNLTKPSKKLCVCCSLLDGSGKALRPSYLMNVLKGLFPGLELQKEEAWAKESAATPKEGLRLLIEGLRAYRAGEENEKFYELYRWYAGQKQYEEKLGQLLEAAFSRHEDSRLGRAVAHALYGTVLENSVTRLERYAACAYAHFLMYGLKLSERERYEFAPVDMGNIFHKTLELFSRRLEGSRYTWTDIPEEVQGAWVEECIDAVTADYGNTILKSSARNAYAIERMKRMMKRTVWALGRQIEKGLFVPENYEISFSGVSDLDAVNIALSQEEQLRLQGRIDRMDLCKEEKNVYVKVIDYKSGNTSFQLLSLYHGLQLQLVVYLNAAMELAAREYPDKEVHPAGIFYYQIQDPMLELGAEGEEGDLNARVMEKLKLSGLVNQDPQVIARLDRDMPGKSSVLPLAYNKDGSLRAGSSVAREQQLRELSAFVNRKIQRLGSEILEGRMDVNPYELKGRTACDFCAYRGVCGLDFKDEGYELRRLKAFEDAEIWERIAEEAGDGKQE